MKKFLIIMSLALSAMSVQARDPEVTPEVLGAFQKEFAAAREISWTVHTEYIQASFVYNDRYLTAYYNSTGELLGLTRFLSPADLPLSLQADLKKNYSEFWITDLFEVASQEGTAYYISVENADSRLILKATDSRKWYHYKKFRKS